ncbi:MAG: flap endonuclease-1 [Candidatus Diapherotrites archaeon]|nr:flap endonuclease-1 [Candidatus Diapherotrites archaeon]
MGTPIGELIVRRPLDWSELAGRRVGFDAYNMIYQFLTNIRSADGNPLMDSKGNVTSHLTGLLYRTASIVENGVKPVFVFDGKPLALKAKTIEARNRIRTNAAEKFEKAKVEGKMEDALKFASMSSKITPEIVESAKQLVQLLGYPVVQAPSDGEAQIAVMVQKGDLYAGVSQDYDALLFGCSRLVRNLAFSGKRKIPGRNAYIDVEPEYLELARVLGELGISREQLVWLGILVGTDFNEKFPRIGPKTALKIVKTANSFEDIISYTEYTPAFDHRDIERIFLEPAYAAHHELSFSAPDREKVRAFLVDAHDFSKERVDNVLEKISGALGQKGSQSRLGDWK